jgi:hypothetical protein
MINTILPQKDGSLRVNDIKSFVRPFWLTPDAPNQTMALAAIVANQAYSPMTITQEGPFQGLSMILQSDRFTAVADHECTCLIQDSGSRKQLSNRPVHANTIFGTSELPMTLPERLFMHENRSLTIRFQNIFNRANNIRPAIAGRRIYATSARSGILDEFILDISERAEVTTNYFLTTTEEINALTVAAGATSFFFPIDADAYFECFKMASVAYDATLGTMTGSFDFILRDAETRRELETGNLSNLLGSGTGLLPFICPESWLIRPKQRVEIQITNTTPSGNPIDVFFTMIGRKIYV